MNGEGSVHKNKAKAIAAAEKTAPQTQEAPTFELGELLRRILEGQAIEPDEMILRRSVVQGLERLTEQTLNSTDGRLDTVQTVQNVLSFQELTFAVCGLLLLLETKRPAASEQPPVKVAVVAKDDKFGIQVWTREDGSDARFRPLSDLEETVLYQHFAKKS